MLCDAAKLDVGDRRPIADLNAEAPIRKSDMDGGVSIQVEDDVNQIDLDVVPVIGRKKIEKGSHLTRSDRAGDDRDGRDCSSSTGPGLSKTRTSNGAELRWWRARARLQTCLETLRTSERRNEHYNVLAGTRRAVAAVAGRQFSHAHSLEKGQGERGRNLKTLIS